MSPIAHAIVLGSVFLGSFLAHFTCVFDNTLKWYQQLMYWHGASHGTVIFRCATRGALRLNASVIVMNIGVGIFIFLGFVGVLPVPFFVENAMALLYIMAALFAITTFLHIRRRNFNIRVMMQGTHCWKCGHDRSGLPDKSSPCPECGFVNPIEKADSI